MPNVTISVSKAVKDKMDEQEDVNWSAVCRMAIEGKIEDLDTLAEIRTLTLKSKLTEKNVEELTQKIREGRKRGTTLTPEERKHWDETHR